MMPNRPNMKPMIWHTAEVTSSEQLFKYGKGIDIHKALMLMYEGKRMRSTEWYPYEWCYWNENSGCLLGWNGTNYTAKVLKAHDCDDWVVWDGMTKDQYDNIMEKLKNGKSRKAK